MNQFTREMIEHAYRTHVTRAPNCDLPHATAEFLHTVLCAQAGRPEISSAEVETDPALSRLGVSIMLAMMRHADEGFPIITMSPDVAWSLSETDVPDDMDAGESEWMLKSNSFLIDIGACGCILGNAGCAPDSREWACDNGDAEWVRRVLADGLGMSSIQHGHIPFSPTGQAVQRLFANVALILQEPPEGISLSIHRPSLKAARKQGRNPACVPHATYVIGSTVALTRRPRADHAATARSGSTWTVRSPRRGHFARQVHGPRNSLRKRIWRMPTWCGPEDAPLSVHAVRIVGHR